MQIPRNIPEQINIIRRAKAGDQEAIAAIRALPPDSWMQSALDDPKWGKQDAKK